MTTEQKSQQVTSTSGSRHYIDADGERYDSVTTIIGGGIPKPFLMPWSNKIAGEFAIEELGGAIRAMKSTYEEALSVIDDPESQLFAEAPLVVRMREGLERLTDGDSVLSLVASGQKGKTETARKRISTASNLVRDTAASRGSFVHDLIEQYVLSGKIPDAPQDDEDAAGMLTQFVRFLNDWQPEFTASEMVVFNREHRYAGTLDFLANIPKLGDGTFIGDVKTGNRIYPEVSLQLAAYAHAEFYETAQVKRSGDGATMPMPELNDQAVVLHLRPDFYELVPAAIGEDQFRMFRMAHQVYWFTKNGKEWLDAPHNTADLRTSAPNNWK